MMAIHDGHDGYSIRTRFAIGLKICTTHSHHFRVSLVLSGASGAVIMGMLYPCGKGSFLLPDISVIV